MPTRFKGTAEEVRALDTLIKVNRATESLWQRLSAGLVPVGITQGQLSVLEALLHLGPMSQGELGRKLLRSNPNMTAVIDNLERDGLVRRERSAEDRRVVRVSLTTEGEKVIREVFPGHAARVTECFSPLTAPEQEQLGALCKKLGLGIATLAPLSSEGEERKRR